MATDTTVLKALLVPSIPVEFARVLAAASRVLPHGSYGICGGAVRDLAHGQPYKDIDLAVWGDTTATQFDDVIQHLREEFGEDNVAIMDEFCHEATIQYAADLGLDPDVANRLEYVTKLTVYDEDQDKQFDLDVLHYGKHHRSLVDVLRTHDHSISQYGAVLEQDKRWVDLYWLADHEPGKCYQLREDVSVDRLNRVMATCERLGWVYVGAEQ